MVITCITKIINNHWEGKQRKVAEEEWERYEENIRDEEKEGEIKEIGRGMVREGPRRKTEEKILRSECFLRK